MTHVDVYSWNALLSAYAKLGLVEDLQGIEDFSEDARRWFQPTQYSYVNALQACSKLLDLKLGKQIHGRVVISGCGDNTFVWNAITGVYGKCGDFHMAQWFFDRMTHKNVVS
ncbi:Pentatricopeptide repeat-containing protein [Arachis hypogaea]|nr:Pentatricopeptide repeat-containing protein [Arachis hypogaea]